MTYKTITLRATLALPRDMQFSRTTGVFMASVMLPGQSIQLTFAAAEASECRFQRTRSMCVLWIGGAAFELLQHEAEAASKLFDLPIPSLPTAAGASLPSPSARAAVGNLLDVHA